MYGMSCIGPICQIGLKPLLHKGVTLVQDKCVTLLDSQD